MTPYSTWKFSKSILSSQSSEQCESMQVSAPLWHQFGRHSLSEEHGKHSHSVSTSIWTSCSRKLNKFLKEYDRSTADKFSKYLSICIASSCCLVFGSSPLISPSSRIKQTSWDSWLHYQKQVESCQIFHYQSK